MTELELHRPADPDAGLLAQMDYARAVAVSSLLPTEYRNKPENVLIAMGLGQSMGLSPAESLYRISVIQGKPTANAELIAASVRKAGHKLRVRGDDQSCTAEIIRHDDPDYMFTVTRDIAWAKQMGLANKDNYKKQPGTMLQWRAITAVARLACPEALYGVAYTPDELYDMSGNEPPPSDPKDRLRAALNKDEPIDGDVVEESHGPRLTAAQSKRMFAQFTDLGITDRADYQAYISNVIKREVETSKDLTPEQASAVIDAQIADLDAKAAK
jgi:hypothetical protein